jgi:predicted heme/steroid binding protein
MRKISWRELRDHDGDQNLRMWVAYDGQVYDVTDCPKWRSGLHENEHFPGQELTRELDEDAPHFREVFDHPCVKRIGELESADDQ